MAEKHRPVLTFKLWKEEVVMGLDREHCHIFITSKLYFSFSKIGKKNSQKYKCHSSAVE